MTEPDAASIPALLTDNEETALRVLAQPAAHGGKCDPFLGTAYGWLVTEALGWAVDDQARVRDLVQRLFELNLTTLTREGAFTTTFDTTLPVTTPLGNEVVGLLLLHPTAPNRRRPPSSTS